ncbi:unnamed protein product [Microthlaspi erraticum]|uniref:F-box domain-containing protein n=1 Tax=Microthlaspi erraticum TaxID=1685480 RepID=A0A6D2JP12_9BRAS|nr:unnamed protein product [Microthlaspi erraticum]
MIMPDLPHDILEDILSRVPATSLKPLRYTCKLWNALFKDQGFTNKHFRVAPKQSLVLMLKERRVVSTSVNLNIGAPSVEYKGALVLKDSHSNHNKSIYLIFLTATRHYRFALGYVNDKKSCRSYKILRWYNDDDKVVGPEIYEFGSDSWRIVDPVAFDCFILLIQQNDVSLKGNAYGLLLRN